MDKKKNKKRVTIKYKNANPLFEKWLKEWLEEAKLKNSNRQHALKNALVSLKKYPLPLQTGKECKILNGFGNTLCILIDKKLDAHNSKADFTSCVNLQINPDVTMKNVLIYNPEFQSECFSILVALYTNTNDEGLTKSHLIQKSQLFCKTTVKCTTTIKDLMERELVSKHGKPIKYSLTETGKSTAKTISEKYKKEIQQLCDLQKDKELHITSTQASISTKNSNEEYETFILTPRNFEIYLLIDTQETSG